MGPEEQPTDTGTALPTSVLALSTLVAAVIAIWSLANIWMLAVPPEAGGSCPLIYPPVPGCAPPDTRFTPAFLSAVLVSLAWATATAMVLTIGRRRAGLIVASLGGLAILGALADRYVTLGEFGG